MLQKLCDILLIRHVFEGSGDRRLGAGFINQGVEEGTLGEGILAGANQVILSPTPCSYYGVQFVSNLLFIFLSLLILLYHKCFKSGNCSKARRHQQNASLPSGTSRNIPQKRGSNGATNNFHRNGKRFSRTDSSYQYDEKQIAKLFQKRRVFNHHTAIWSFTVLILVAVGADLSENVILVLHKYSTSNRNNNNDTNIINSSNSNTSSNFSGSVNGTQSDGGVDDRRTSRVNRFISSAPSTLFENYDSNGTLIDLTASSSPSSSSTVSSSSDNHSHHVHSPSRHRRHSVLFLVRSDSSGGGSRNYDDDVHKKRTSRSSGSSAAGDSFSGGEHGVDDDHQIIYEYLKIIGPLVTLTAVSVLLLYYHQFERTVEAKHLLVNVFFFALSGILFLVNAHLYWGTHALSFVHVKVTSNAVSAVGCVILTGLLAHTVIHEKKGAGLSSSSSKDEQDQSTKTKRKNSSRNNNSNGSIRYLHNYSTLPSRITFYWFTGLLRLGYSHPLEEEDLGDLPDEEKTSTQLKRFENVYEFERRKSPGQLFSLWRCLFKTIWPSLLVGGLFRLLADFTGFIAPLGIKGIVAFTELNYTLFEDGEDGVDGTGSSENLTITQLISNGYVMALVVLLASFLQSTFSQCSTFLVNSEGIHIKFALQALIYKKSLTLSPTKSAQNVGTEDLGTDSASTRPDHNDDDGGDVDDDKESGTSSTGRHSSSTTTTTHGFDNGSIVNIMSEDTNNVMMFFWMAHFIWAIPLKLGILMTLLYFQLGYSALIGAGVCILIMIPLQFLIGKKMSSNSKELMERCDDRLRSISEILQGIKLLKMHGWELLFSEKVYLIRQKELKNLDKDLLYRSIMTFLTHISSVLVTVVTFGLYPIIESEKLEPPKVFAGLALFNQLTVPLFIFPITVPVVIDALVSTRRVREFLLLPEASSLPEQQDGDNGNNEYSRRRTIGQTDDEEGLGHKGLGIVKPQQNLMSLPPSLLNNKCSSSSPRNVQDLQASSDSVFVLENIAEDEEELQETHNNDTSYNKNSLTGETSRLLPAMESANGTANSKEKGLLDENGKNNSNYVVWVKNASYSWDESTTTALSSLPGVNNHNHPHHHRRKSSNKQRPNGISEISVEIPKEKLTVVVGPTGSGKSSFISALLGEMRRTGGEMSWAPGTGIAYAAQKAWMLNASVRENILFGQPFKPGRYKKVIQACALQPDIDILPENDFTEIGQKGINLSGGQKQRIATARALYSNANVVILDDPLSALDVEVAHHVLDAGITKFLLRSRRTVILVTHHLPVLHHAHHIIAMERGGIRIQGTLSEIQSRDPDCYREWQEMISRKEQELNVQREQKTARERWTLLKLVSRVGLQFKHNRMAGNKVWKTEEETNAQLEPFRKKKGTFLHYKNLSHDIFLPSDECHDEMMTPLLRRRAVSRTSRDSRTSASSSKHVQLQRMSSLQPETIAGKNRSPSVGKKFKRLQSLPAEDDVVEEAICTNPAAITTTTSTQASLPRNNVFGNASTSGGGGGSGTMTQDLPSPSPRVQDNLFKKLFSSKKTISSTGSSNTELEKIPTTGAMSPSSVRLSSTVSGASEGDLTEDELEDPEEALIARESSQDEREYGKIPLKVYLSYIRACGKVVSGLYLYSAIGYEVVRVYTNFWLTNWSDTVYQYKDDEEKYEEIMSYYFNVYVILSFATVIVSLSCNLLGKQAGANSREILHQRMMDRVVRCPVRFFESTPIGRIINRFSSDVAVVDRKLCISMQRFLQFVSLCISAIVVNAIVNAWFLLLAIPIVAIYYYIQRFYRFSSRELQRIQAISRGPIYSHFHETLEGLSTIRAFREQKRFTNQMLATLDAHNKADMFINVGNRWLSISLDYLGGVIVFLATLAAVISSYIYPEAVTASMVGLAINYTLLVPVYLNWVVKFLAEVEMFMNSVDRIDRYAELEIEDYEGEIPEDCLPASWPTSGDVKFENITVQYGPDRPAIISGLSVGVRAKQKVGICGRSGSGKSSLLMALFRISDVTNGQILIDGMNIHQIPLLKLRSSFAIIPQENIMFSGTLRFNLDPEGKIPDLDIWSALERCQMKEAVEEMPGQLDADIKFGGDSFSAGERQLLSLARAILHKSKIVIMDEATSSMDIATERTLLQVVSDVFKDSTVLTIAHRLDTIIDGDRVLVLEDGRLVEDGNPAVLIKKPMSHFATMVRNSSENRQI